MSNSLGPLITLWNFTNIKFTNIYKLSPHKCLGKCLDAVEYKLCFMKTWFTTSGVEKLLVAWTKRWLNCTEPLWDELEWLHTRPFHLTSVPDWVCSCGWMCTNLHSIIERSRSHHRRRGTEAPSGDQLTINAHWMGYGMGCLNLKHSHTFGHIMYSFFFF